jgi:DNA invertase Pin-like site-specific DNA recombinase
VELSLESKGKVCTRCNGFKSASDFYRQGNRHESLCKECKKISREKRDKVVGTVAIKNSEGKHCEVAVTAKLRQGKMVTSDHDRETVRQFDESIFYPEEKRRALGISDDDMGSIVAFFRWQMEQREKRLKNKKEENFMSRENAVVLSRISDQKQDDGYSLDAQERFGLEYCQKKGFNVVEKFRFIETGSKVGKRHKFDSMMDYIKDQIGRQKGSQVTHLIVEKPDRLTRNFTNREQLQLFVMTGKLEIHYYKDRRIVDKNCSPADVFTDDMMTSVSMYIALNIAREVKKGLLEKARNGWYPAHPPVGYKYTREGVVGKHGRKEARIIIDSEMKSIVYRIFELRAVGKKSYGAIGSIVREEFD